MKTCKDGRIWGQNNKEAGSHLGFATGRKSSRSNYIKKGYNPKSISAAWKGGIPSESQLVRQSTEYKAWRISVFLRDDWTCQECGQIGYILHAHHIQSFSEFPELRFTVENGITLCKECHKKTDTYLKHILREVIPNEYKYF